MNIGKCVTKTINYGLSTEISDKLFQQKEHSVTWECEKDCDVILYDSIGIFVKKIKI
jgi:hypothetical protein